MIDLAALRVVRAIADHGGVTAAAGALGLSQPAVSQTVRRLEQRLGTPVVRRSGRTVRLTEAGEVLARHAVTVLGAVAAAEEEVAAIAGLRSGRVRLLAFPSSSATLVPRALARMRAEHPGVEVRFAEAEPPQSLDLLRSGECDVAVAFGYPGGEVGRGEDDLTGLEVRHLLDDPMHVALPAGHPLAERDAVSVADLAGSSWIAGCPRCRGHLLALCHTAGYEPQVTYATDDYVAVLGLVAAGLGVAVIPGLVLATAHHHEVVTRPLSPASVRGVWAVTTRDLLRVPAVAACLRTLDDAARPLR